MKAIGRYLGLALILLGLLATYAAWATSYVWGSAWLLHHHHARLLSLWLGPGLGVCLVLALLLSLPVHVIGVLLFLHGHGREHAPGMEPHSEPLGLIPADSPGPG